MLTCRDSDHESLDSFAVVDSFVERLVDAVGAGDALLAYATLGHVGDRQRLRGHYSGFHSGGVRVRVRRAIFLSRPMMCAARSTLIERQATYN